jgi:hypothetical protein
LSTFQWSLVRLSGLYLLVLVPPFHFLDNLSMTLNVFCRWFPLLHLLRNTSQTQVVPDTDGSVIVVKTTKQVSFWVTLLLPTLARERTFQNMIGLHFCYWCIVVLWEGLRLSVALHPTRRRHFYVFSVFFRVFFLWWLAFFEEKKSSLGVLVQWIHWTTARTVHVSCVRYHCLDLFYMMFVETCISFMGLSVIRMVRSVENKMRGVSEGKK